MGLQVNRQTHHSFYRMAQARALVLRKRDSLNDEGISCLTHSLGNFTVSSESLRRWWMFFLSAMYRVLVDQASGLARSDCGASTSSQCNTGVSVPLCKCV